MEYDQSLDVKGLKCPLPVLKTRKRLQGMAAGAVLRVEADDPVAAVDLPEFCDQAGHTLLQVQTGGGVQLYLIRKGGG